MSIIVSNKDKEIFIDYADKNYIKISINNDSSIYIDNLLKSKNYILTERKFVDLILNLIKEIK